MASIPGTLLLSLRMKRNSAVRTLNITKCPLILFFRQNLNALILSKDVSKQIFLELSHQSIKSAAIAFCRVLYVSCTLFEEQASVMHNFSVQYCVCVLRVGRGVFHRSAREPL